jgi:hypothetical protein
MKLSSLFFISIVTIAAAPHSSLAQMQIYRSNNMSGQNRVANGEEVKSEKINRIMMLDGQKDIQTVNFSISREGSGGPTNEFMQRQIEKQLAGQNPLKQEAAVNSTEDEDGDPISISSNKYVDDDQFSITGTVTITEQNYNMTEMMEEEILIERRDAFSSTSNTQSFSTGSGFSGRF